MYTLLVYTTDEEGGSVQSEINADSIEKALEFIRLTFSGELKRPAIAISKDWENTES